VPGYNKVLIFGHFPDLVPFSSEVSVFRPPIAGNLVNDKLRVSGNAKSPVLLKKLFTYLNGCFRTFVFGFVVGEPPERGLLGMNANEAF
jgi:hypothetical protein